MESINYNASFKTPRVVLDKANETFLITGRSLPEDARSFYNPILKWLREYFESPNKKTTLIFEIIYFNTASSKMLLDLFYVLGNAIEAGHDLLVVWGYEEEDEEVLEAGEDYVRLTGVPVQFKIIDNPND